MEFAADKLEKLLGSADAPLIVDVRSHFEYRSGHLPGAFFMPFWKIPFLAGRIAADRNARIVVYCEHGPRALLAVRFFNMRGFQNVLCLKGHMHSWRAEKRKLAR